MMSLKTLEESFSVLQWNCLADHLCDSSGFPYVQPEFLDFQHRKVLFQKIFPNIVADIICLEEIDHPDFFTSLLPEHYECFFQKKPQNLDGILLAFNTNKFRKLEFNFHSYRVNDETSNQFFMALKLEVSLSTIQMLSNNKVLTVIGTHLKAKKENDDVRIQQIQSIVEYVVGNYQNSDNYIIMGDFNSEPSYDSMKLFKAELNQKFSHVNYANHMTSFKIRKQVECRTIDYIFYSKKTIKLVAENNLMTKENIGQSGLPSIIFPSDHLYLFSVFTYARCAQCNM